DRQVPRDAPRRDGNGRGPRRSAVSGARAPRRAPMQIQSFASTRSMSVAACVALAGAAASAQSGAPLFPGRQHAAGAQPASVAAGDGDGDGRLDLAAAESGANTVSVRLGGGLGDFAAPVAFAAGAQPSCVALGDVDGDGDLDLAASNAGSNDVSVLLGNGTGGF